MGATVAVTGDVATEETARNVARVLAETIGEREARADTKPLTPGICGLAALLPAAPSGAMTLRLGFGDSDEPNLTGAYSVGDTPVIDVLMPAEPSEGHLWVAVADVTGKLYNLLPRLNQPTSAIADLGTVSGGLRRVRVTYGAAEAREDPAARLRFQIDDSFGTSLILALRTDRPLFDTLRPTEETIPSFAQDLAAALDRGGAMVEAITTQPLVSRK